MTTWNPRANDLFLKALELCSDGARQEYLDGACAGDAALRAEVESLLEATGRAGAFLEFPAPALLLAAKAELVKLRFFAGLTMPEAAAALEVSLATAERYWTFAKSWLYAELADDA